MSTAVGSSSCAWTCEHGGCEPPFNRKEITGTHELSCVPVAVPVRGAGCIRRSRSRLAPTTSCCPREGRGLHLSRSMRCIMSTIGCCCPREGRGLHLVRIALLLEMASCCCPREGRGLHLAYGGIINIEAVVVAVPVRGAGCIGKRIQTCISIFGGSSQPVNIV